LLRLQKIKTSNKQAALRKFLKINLLSNQKLVISRYQISFQVSNAKYKPIWTEKEEATV